MKRLGRAAAMVLEHLKSLRNMGAIFILKLEGYGDVRSELGGVRVSLKGRSSPLKLHLRRIFSRVKMLK